MRNKAAVILFATLGALLFAVGPVRAQLADAEVRAKVPFPFYAGNTLFPAGSYKVSRLDPTDPNELIITTGDGKVSALIEVDQSQKPTTAPKATATELSFDKYGTRYFLSGVTVQGDTNSSMLQKSRLEMLMSKGEVSGQGRQVSGTKAKKGS